MITKRRILLCLLSALGFMSGMLGPEMAWAADIQIAHVSAMTGPIGVAGRQYDAGIKIALDAVNAQGGVNGHKLVLKTIEDESKPDKFINITRDLAKTNTLAMILPIGAESVAKALHDKVFESAGMPVVGAIPGAEPLRKPGSAYLFHVRAGDMDQYKKLVRNALTIGLNRMAIVYSDVGVGKAGLANIESLLTPEKVEPVLRLPVPIKPHADYSQVLSQLEKAKPNIVVIIIPAQIAAEFIRAYRERGLQAPLYTPSYGDPDTICSVATPAKARGVGVAQVIPNLRDNTLPLVRRFQDDFKKYGPKDVKPSILHLEAYISSQVLIEGIRRIHGEPTRDKLLTALNGMTKTDLGGFTVDYSPTKHTGSEFVDIGIIGTECKLMF